MNRCFSIVATVWLAALACVAPTQSRAQEVRNTQGSTFLRLDAVDVSNAAEHGQFVFFASFLDRGRKPVTALDPKAWVASFDGNPIEAELKVARLFDQGQNEGISLVVVLQNDHVAKESFLDPARKGVKKLLSTLRQVDKSAVVLFRDTTDKSGTLSPAHNETSSWMDTIQDGGLTPILYESIEQALSLFPAEFSAIGPNRAVLVIADGADQRDNQSFVVSCSRVLRGHRADVTCLDFAAPNMLATGSNDAYVMLWNFGSGQIRSQLHHQPLTPQPRVNPSSASAHKFVTTTTCVAVERLALIKLDGEYLCS
jgi:WD40 repeat protein